MPVKALLGLAVALAASAPAGANTTFYQDVLPILQKRCQGCHRPGEVGPMSFLSYRDARPWAKSIREAVLIRKMPPWFADPGHGKFLNDPSLSKQEIDTLTTWADTGALEGNPQDAPQPVQWVEGWNIGKPDLVFEMPKEFPVPAAGTIEYQHIVVPTRFTEDRWVQASEVRPGNRAVVHHVIAYVREPGSKWLREAAAGEPFVPRRAPAGEENFLPGAILAGFAPGLPPTYLHEHQGILIRAGSDLVFQMHYTANGKPAGDRTRVGLVFAKKPPRERIVNLAPHNQDFMIPAGAANHRVDAKVTLSQPVTLLSLMPHMHFRGKAFEMRAVYPDRSQEVLLRIPRYDFNWQLYYALEKPRVLPQGTRVECTAWFDNSANNKYNPDPKSAVRWGDQTWEEMAIGWMTVAVDSDARVSGLVKEKRSAPTE